MEVLFSDTEGRNGSGGSADGDSLRRYDFVPTGRKLPRNVKTLVGIGFFSDCHGRMCHSANAPNYFAADVPMLIKRYVEFKKAFRGFAKRVGRKPFTALVGVGDIVGSEGPLCWTGSGAVTLLRELRRSGLRRCVVGNHEVNQGLDWLFRVLAREGGPLPRYGSHNLRTDPVSCTPPVLPWTATWLTTDEAVLDIANDTTFTLGGKTVAVGPCDPCMICDPAFGRHYDSILAHVGWIDEKVGARASDPDSIKRAVHRWGDGRRGLNLVIDGHSHLQIPPLIGDHDDDPNFGNGLYYLQVRGSGEAIGFVTFGIDDERQVVVDCVRPVGRKVPYFFAPSRRRNSLSKEGVEARQMDSLLNKEAAVLGTRVSLDVLSELSPGDPRGQLARYACKCIYLWARASELRPKPDVVVLNRWSVSEGAITKEESPFYSGRPAPRDCSLGELTGCYKASTLIALELPPQNPDNVSDLLNLLRPGCPPGDALESYPEAGEIRATDPGKNVVWTVAFLGSKLGKVDHYFDEFLLPSVVGKYELARIDATRRGDTRAI